MTLNITIPENINDTKPKISVIGIGGAGGNAVNTMISEKIENIDFIVANTDGQALSRSLTSKQIQLGKSITLGLGAGSDAETGRKAAEESIEEIIAELSDVNMLFITTGMGGGTGSGAAPVIAKAAREKGILTVAVVTKPFDFEGKKRMDVAEKSLSLLKENVDTLIVIPNQNLFKIANEKTTFAEAFKLADLSVSNAFEMPLAIASLSQGTLITVFAFSRPACRSPISTVGIPKKGASMIPLDEFPTTRSKLDRHDK